jgi:hypothetical protein
VYTVILLGGIWFWLLVLAEVIFLYNCMGLERTKGANATASLVGFLTLLFCFSDLKTWALTHWGWSSLAYVVFVALTYVALGLCWSFFWMWPRWGQKRKQIHKKKLTEWLETQGIRGDVCPDELKKELNLVVFGNTDQEPIERLLNEVKGSYRRQKGLATTERIIPGSEEAAFLTLVTTTDPETIEERTFRREVSELRKEWLKTQKVHKADLGIVIPERLMARFTERVTTPFVRREGNKEWGEIATEPLFRRNKGKLATWAAWWPVSVLWYVGHDLFHELALAAITLFEGIGQRLMHKQYRDVRADFEITEPPVAKK